MGALTAKKKAFQNRPWEPRSFVEIDDSEITIFKIRVEKLKNNRVRILPIKYWISDIERFKSEKKYGNINLLIFKLLAQYNLKLTESVISMVESFNIKYIVGIYQITRKIVRYIKKKPLNIILSRTIPNNTLNSLVNQYTSFFLPNLLPPSSSLGVQKISFNAYVKLPLDVNTPFILTCNPRLLSPTFNSFLFQNLDVLELTLFGGFSLNQYHEELPSSNYTISKIINNHYDKMRAKFIISQDDTRFSGLNVDIIQLGPIFLQSDEKRYAVINKNVKTIIDFDLSISPKSNYTAFLSTYSNELKNNSEIYVPTNIDFDKFLLTRISQKFLKRIELMFFFIIPIVKNNSLTYRNNNSKNFHPFMNRSSHSYSPLLKLKNYTNKKVFYSTEKDPENCWDKIILDPFYDWVEINPINQQLWESYTQRCKNYYTSVNQANIDEVEIEEMEREIHESFMEYYAGLKNSDVLIEYPFYDWVEINPINQQLWESYTQRCKNYYTSVNQANIDEVEIEEMEREIHESFMEYYAGLKNSDVLIEYPFDHLLNQKTEEPTMRKMQLFLLEVKKFDENTDEISASYYPESRACYHVAINLCKSFPLLMNTQEDSSIFFNFIFSNYLRNSVDQPIIIPGLNFIGLNPLAIRYIKASKLQIGASYMLVYYFYYFLVSKINQR